MSVWNSTIGFNIGEGLCLYLSRKQYGKKFNSITEMEDYIIDSLKEDHRYVTHIINPDNSVFLIMDCVRQ